MKTCTSCKIEKSLGNFYSYLRKSRQKICINSVCKECWYVKTNERRISRKGTEKYKEDYKKYRKTYYYKHHDEVLKRMSDFKKKFKESLTPEQTKQRNKEVTSKYLARRKKYPEIRIKQNLRSRLVMAIKNINKKTSILTNRTMDYVGCTKEELKNHIESLWKKDMNWENYGEWEIDHVYPLSRIDIRKEENIYKVMNYRNLQPLWGKENRLKWNLLPGESRKTQPLKAQLSEEFIVEELL